MPRPPSHACRPSSLAKAQLVLTSTCAQVKDARVGAGVKIGTGTFTQTGRALEAVGLGFFEEVGRCAVKEGGKLGYGPYEQSAGKGTPCFVKLTAYTDEQSGLLARAGTDVETMAAAKDAVQALPELKKDKTQEAAKLLMGLASMSYNLHLLVGESSFARVLKDADAGRVGTKEGWTSAESLHKHLLQLMIALRIGQGAPEGLELDPAIPMPPKPSAQPPRTPLMATNGNATVPGSLGSQ